MDKCITCLPNGNIKQHEYAKFLKDNNINKIVYRLGEDKDWNFTTPESWQVLSKIALVFFTKKGTVIYKK